VSCLSIPLLGQGAMLLRMLVAPLLVATAHGLNGLWQQAEAQPVESYPGSSKDCHDGLSCRACLTAGCGYYGSCLPSCDMIADVACYEGDAEKRCAAYESSQRESKLCEAASASCEVCTAKTKANGASCRWFADIGACMAEGGMIGPGESVCPQAERVHVHVAAPTCPANCKLYFDGCNNCRCFPGGAMGCTRMACDPAKRMRPYCKEESAPAIVGTDIV
jgi:hypothetical protein